MNKSLISRMLLAPAMALLLIGVSPAHADYASAVALLNTGNNVEAYRQFSEVANEGHVRAQLQLGRLYHEGRGTSRDPVMAVKWLTLAYLSGMRQQSISLLEDLRSELEEEEVVRAEQLALEWLEDAQRTLFADDDTDSLYQQF